MLTDPSEPSGKRSQKGCWTCKLRRKKCDENHPICESCGSLGITCDGYGPKPDWMDRGPLEREMARKVKMTVARNGHKRSRSRWAMSPLIPSAEKCSQDNTAATKSTSPGLTVHGPLSPQHNDNLPTLLEGVFTTDFATDILSWQDPITPGNTDDIGDFALSPSTISPQGSAALDNFSLPEDFPVCPELRPSTSSFLSDSQRNTVTEESHRIVTEQPRQRQPIDTYSHIRRSSSISEDSQASTISFTPSGLSSCYYSSTSSSTENAFLLSYYMSRVIYTQFSFSIMSEPRSSQWLQFVLLGSEHALEISMILGRAHYISTKKFSEAEYASRYEDDMSRVVNILKTVIPPLTNTKYLLGEKQGVSSVIEICASLVQNIHLEVGPSTGLYEVLVLILSQIFYGGSSRWEDCMREAAPYILPLIDLTVSRNKPRNSTNTMLDEVPSLQSMAAKALLGKLIWFDVLATVSAGKGPFLGISHTVFFNSYDIDMVEASGCHNSVVTALAETVTLQHWKTQTEREGRLSVIQLVTRGGAIVDTLNNLSSKLAHASTTRSTTESTICGGLFSKIATKSPEEMARDITLAYSRAALVHLHFVLSGHNPDVEEIRRGTVELVESLKTLSDGRMLGYTLWPLCVAVCAVKDEEEERTLFQTMNLEEQDLRHVHPRTYQSIRDIGRECRRLRFMEGGKSSWARTMDRLQRHLLLA